MTKRKLNKQQKSRISCRQQNLDAETTGLVISHHGKESLVELTNGKQVKCHNRQNIGNLVAGDRVVVDLNTPTPVALSRLERRSVLGRANARGELKPIAANIDTMIIVFAVLPEPSDLLIDSYLVASHHLGIQPLLVFNKTDLAHEKLLSEHYRALNYALIEVSTLTGKGLDALSDALANKTSVFVGQSGVGKSSLIKTFLPTEAIETQAISEKYALGRHTTSNSHLYHLSQTKGQIIDSPGIREFSLSTLPTDAIIHGFPEFQSVLGLCKYRNCTHISEPDCAISKEATTCTHKAQRVKNLKHLLQKHTTLSDR